MCSLVGSTLILRRQRGNKVAGNSDYEFVGINSKSMIKGFGRETSIAKGYWKCKTVEEKQRIMGLWQGQGEGLESIRSFALLCKVGKIHFNEEKKILFIFPNGMLSAK